MRNFVIHNFDQRSPEWYKIRAGRITGTRVANILGKEGLAKTNSAIDNLALTLATESIIGVVENDFVSYDMQRGIDQEPMAFSIFKEKMALNFVEVKNVGFISLGNNMGFSPDGILSNNEGLEIKCPTPSNFFKVLANDYIDPSYMAQIQFGMFVTGFNKWNYVNYLLHMGKEYTHQLDVNRDEDMINLIDERCDKVIKRKAEYIEILNKKLNNN